MQRKSKSGITTPQRYVEVDCKASNVDYGHNGKDCFIILLFIFEGMHRSTCSHVQTLICVCE